MSAPPYEQARQILEAIFLPVAGESTTDAARRALGAHDRGVRPLGVRERAAAEVMLARAWPEEHRTRAAAQILIGGAPDAG